MQGKSYALSPLAEIDLEEIWFYTFRHWSLAQADSYHRDLIATCFKPKYGDRLFPISKSLFDGYFSNQASLSSISWGQPSNRDGLTNGPLSLGICLPYDGTFKITAQVGGGDVPAPVSEAFKRLAAYLADDPGTAGASSTSVAIGPIQESLDRSPNWVARAMQHSGAGDLLRPYRRA